MVTILMQGPRLCLEDLLLFRGHMCAHSDTLSSSASASAEHAGGQLYLQWVS